MSGLGSPTTGAAAARARAKGSSSASGAAAPRRRPPRPRPQPLLLQQGPGPEAKLRAKTECKMAPRVGIAGVEEVAAPAPAGLVRRDLGRARSPPRARAGTARRSEPAPPMLPVAPAAAAAAAAAEAGLGAGRVARVELLYRRRLHLPRSSRSLRSFHLHRMRPLSGMLWMHWRSLRGRSWTAVLPTRVSSAMPSGSAPLQGTTTAHSTSWMS
mmetsp:Transcript_46489/g.132193  ORF Transcript_46489/g.132193 Transcript_46489/m.132193 type:complete len:213 (+) Transcript_46489:101-739(+)